MPLDASISGNSSDIDRMLEQSLSHEARRAYILRGVIEQRARIEAERQGAKVTLTVDGIKNTTESMIKDTSVVVWRFQWIGDLIRWIDQQLIIHSPVEKDATKAVPGQYERSFIAYADGSEFDLNDKIPEQAEEYIIMNTQPYAGKIERGRSPQDPDGVFQVVAALAANLVDPLWATVHFEYRTPPFEEVVLRHFGSRAFNLTPAIIILAPAK
jgi:hypothetical protein